MLPDPLELLELLELLVLPDPLELLELLVLLELPDPLELEPEEDVLLPRPVAVATVPVVPLQAASASSMQHPVNRFSRGVTMNCAILINPWSSADLVCRILVLSMLPTTCLISATCRQ